MDSPPKDCACISGHSLLHLSLREMTERKESHASPAHHRRNTEDFTADDRPVSLSSTCSCSAWPCRPSGSVPAGSVPVTFPLVNWTGRASGASSYCCSPARCPSSAISAGATPPTMPCSSRRSSFPKSTPSTGATVNATE